LLEPEPDVELDVGLGAIVDAPIAVLGSAVMVVCEIVGDATNDPEELGRLLAMVLRPVAPGDEKKTDWLWVDVPTLPTLVEAVTTPVAPLMLKDERGTPACAHASSY